LKTVVEQTKNQSIITLEKLRLPKKKKIVSESLAAWGMDQLK
jgi:hypothetical protein